MARYSFGMRGTIAGTNVLPSMSIFATASGGFKLVEVGVYNTTTTALVIALARLTAVGTAGAAQTEGEMAQRCSFSPLATVFAGHTGSATVGQVLRQGTLGAAAGAGVIWTFGNGGIVVPTDGERPRHHHPHRLRADLRHRIHLGRVSAARSRLVAGIASQVHNFGTNPGATPGYICDPGISNAEGSWTEILSDTVVTQDCCGFYLRIDNAVATPTGRTSCA